MWSPCPCLQEKVPLPPRRPRTSSHYSSLSICSPGCPSLSPDITPRNSSFPSRPWSPGVPGRANQLPPSEHTKQNSHRSGEGGGSLPPAQAGDAPGFLRDAPDPSDPSGTPHTTVAAAFRSRPELVGLQAEGNGAVLQSRLRGALPSPISLNTPTLLSFFPLIKYLLKSE